MQIVPPGHGFFKTKRRKINHGSRCHRRLQRMTQEGRSQIQEPERSHQDHNGRKTWGLQSSHTGRRSHRSWSQWPASGDAQRKEPSCCQSQHHSGGMTCSCGPTSSLPDGSSSRPTCARSASKATKENNQLD